MARAHDKDVGLQNTEPSLNWNLSSMNRKRGRPRKNWQDIIRRDLKDIGLTWNEASEPAHSRRSWCQLWPTQCDFDTK